jgi:hypothetical protein
MKLRIGETRQIVPGAAEATTVTIQTPQKTKYVTPKPTSDADCHTPHYPHRQSPRNHAPFFSGNLAPALQYFPYTWRGILMRSRPLLRGLDR